MTDGPARTSPPTGDRAARPAAAAPAGRPAPAAPAGRPAPAPPAGSPYGPEIAAEHAGWAEIQDLVHRLTPSERLVPGYYPDSGWSVKDMLAHVGTWLAQGEIELERIAVGTYTAPPTDIDALNARFLAAMRDQPWDIVADQAAAARTQMLRAWYVVRTASPDATWWVRKAGPDHYEEHLARLREWVDELLAARQPA